MNTITTEITSRTDAVERRTVRVDIDAIKNYCTKLIQDAEYRGSVKFLNSFYLTSGENLPNNFSSAKFLITKNGERLDQEQINTVQDLISFIIRNS